MGKQLIVRRATINSYCTHTKQRNGVIRITVKNDLK
jgi:hypothetical protein